MAEKSDPDSAPKSEKKAATEQPKPLPKQVVVPPEVVDSLGGPPQILPTRPIGRPSAVDAPAATPPDTPARAHNPLFDGPSAAEKTAQGAIDLTRQTLLGMMNEMERAAANGRVYLGQLSAAGDAGAKSAERSDFDPEKAAKLLGDVEALLERWKPRAK